MKKNGVARFISSTCLTLVLAAVLVFAGACDNSNGGTPTPSGGGPTGPAIKIGAAVPLTGIYAAGGNELRFGYEQAVRDINANGGIYVSELDAYCPLEIKILDDESDPTKTISRLNSLADEGVVVYAGTYSSELNGPAAGIAERDRIPIVAGSFSNLSPHLQGYQYLFSPFVKTDKGVEMIFELLDSLGSERPSKIAVWAEQTDWGEELSELVPAAAREHGYTVVQNERYSEMTIEFSSLVLAAKSAGAEVVIAVPTPTTALTMMKDIKSNDYNPKATVFWRGASTSLWAANLGPIGDYTLFLSNWNWNFEYPGNAELVEIYRATEGKLPTVTVGNGYAVIQLIADAVSRAGSLDSDKIRDAIAATEDLMTVQGLIERFEADGVAVCPAAIMQWQNQLSEVVFHEEYENATFRYPTPPWSER